MTDGEALTLIASSQAFKKAEGNFRGAWLNFATLNPRAADWLLACAGGEIGTPVPVGVTDTPYGRGMRHFAQVGKFALVPTSTTPTTPPVTKPPLPTQVRAAVTGAMVIRGGAMMDSENSNDGLKVAGVKYVAIQIAPEDNDVRNNLAAFDNGMKAWFEARGFKVGGFVVNYFDPAIEAEVTAKLIDKLGLHFLVSDIERHKADLPGGGMELTTILARNLRFRLPEQFPIWFVGYGQHSAPSVVNHSAMDEAGIDYIDEAYDQNGYTDGVVAGIDKITRENRVPADLALGNKSLAADAPTVYKLRETAGTRLRDVWLWCPESGEAQADLGQGIDLVP